MALPTSPARWSAGSVVTVWRWAIGVVAALNAVAALGGAIGLMTGWLSLEQYTERLPFGSAVLGGLALGLLVAVPQAWVALLSLRGSQAAAAGSVAAGVGMVVWILVEVAFLRVFAGLQIVYLGVGLAQIGVGLLVLRHDRDEKADWGPWPLAPTTRPRSRG